MHFRKNRKIEIVNKGLENHVHGFASNLLTSWKRWQHWEEFSNNISYHSNILSLSLPTGIDPPTILKYGCPALLINELDPHHQKTDAVIKEQRESTDMYSSSRWEEGERERERDRERER